MNVKNLHLMQDGFRHAPDVVSEMTRHAKNGKFNLSSNLIAITEFEDGERYIRDGFHRALAIHMGRPDGMLSPDEYFIEYLTYEKMNQLNFGVCYYTPFDVKTEIRTSDFGEYKAEVNRLISVGKDPIPFIERNRRAYCCKRLPQHDTVESYAKFWLGSLELQADWFETPMKILEEFDGWIEKFDETEDIAYVTLRTNGEELIGEYPISKFVAHGIEERNRFRLRTFEIDDFVGIQFNALPDGIITDQFMEELDRDLAFLKEYDA